jgi:hypothetical protein
MGQSIGQKSLKVPKGTMARLTMTITPKDKKPSING